jgi:predicted phosphate transport protein (TIGR00153 family)
MANWLNNYFSSGNTFYKLFGEVSNNLTEMCNVLIDGLDEGATDERDTLFKRIDDLEKKGDDLTHKIYLALEKHYFTPFNKKDMYVLASAMDDVADQIQETTGRIQLYNIDTIKPAIKEMALYIQKAIGDVEKLTHSLADIKLHNGQMYIWCKEVKYNEHQTDLIYYSALAELFSHEKNAITLLKYRDILYSLETAANKCKNTADAFETIMVSSLN